MIKLESKRVYDTLHVLHVVFTPIILIVLCMCECEHCTHVLQLIAIYKMGLISYRSYISSQLKRPNSLELFV